MARGTLGVVVGLVVWMSVITVAGFVMRATWPANLTRHPQRRAAALIPPRHLSSNFVVNAR